MDANDFITEDLCLLPSLRIALVTETYPPEVNGVAMTLGRMVEGLLARGHRVQLIRPRQTTRDQAAQGQGFEEILAWGLQIPRYEGLRFGLPARHALIRQWSRQRPDLVHVATEGPLGWSAVSAASKLRLPVTSDFHTNFDHYSSHYGVGWLRQPVAAYLRRFHNRTERTFVPTEPMAESLRKQGYQRVEVIARGVDCALFNPARRSPALRASWGLAPGDLAVVSVGRVAPEKNLPLTLAAFAGIRQVRPDARLVMIGDGPLRTQLAQRHPEHIYAGMRTGEDLAAHYASADLFLFPSLTETYGNVTLEAMASGLGVVAYDCAAAAEVVKAEVEGLKAPPGDEAGFIRAAVELARDDALRARLALAARARAETLDWDRIHDRFAAALAETAARPARPARAPLLGQPRSQEA
ncbi:MAG: glycosyltransferase family 1 protein [Rhodocyclaceae bacterium]|jgi:glycosyltransferase involved in cell wall biosynthesis|nr:glycosyltransferase family 1 protein [Rhodocyclaceae bacterium]